MPSSITAGASRPVGNALHRLADQRGEQARLLGHARAEHDRQHQAERREAGEGSRHLGQQLADQLLGQQALGGQQLAGDRD